MSAHPGGVPTETGEVYIRGGGGVTVDTRSAWRVVAVVCLAGLAVLVVLLTVDAFRQNSRRHDLQAHGVPVRVAVTGCLGLASGTGVTASSYQCRGSFTLDGQRRLEVLRGSRALLARGSVVAAVVVPAHPDTLTLKSALQKPQRSWTAFVTPGALFIVLVVGAAVVAVMTRDRYEGAKVR